MRTQIKLALTLMAAAALIQTARGSDDAEQSEFPVITVQPADQGVYEGSPVTFAVQAKNGRKFQWLRNGVALEDQTNSLLAFESVSVDDVGLYSCEVAKEDGEAVPTRAASLNVLTDVGPGPIIVYGTPLVSGGKRGSCPGQYVGYINYVKTIGQGWGWVPTAGTTVHTASDTTRTNTKVSFTGRYLDSGCGTNFVTVPDPAPSPSYRFTIFFTNNVPTSSYPITLIGFDP